MNKLKAFVKSTSGETREVLEELVHNLANEIKSRKRLEAKIEQLTKHNRLLCKKIFGSSSEKITDTNGFYQVEADLFDEFELCSEEVEVDAPAVPEENTQAAPKKKKGRKPLPKDLPRNVIEHDLSDEEKQCACGNEMECIGADVSEQLDYQPAKLQVIEHRCKKYGCADCNEASKKDPLKKASIKTAAKPLVLIPRSIATPSLLAQIVVQKFADHLPLYRQEQIFKRYAIALSRQTMSEWMLKVGQAVIPIINLMQDKILEYNVAFADETTLQVLHEPGRRAQTKSYIWCFIGGPLHQRIVIYQYHASRKGEVPNSFFEGYQGALHCDGYTAYEKLLSTSGIVGVNCMAHVRRKFFEALPNGKEKGVSGHVIKVLRVLYRIEDNLKAIKADAETIKQRRLEKSKPILEELKKYLDEKGKVVPPKSNVGEAIKYTLKRWNYLTTYLDDGRYEIDNNRAERAIKPFVTGRKNWLFANSTSGAHTSARLFSLIETAKSNDIYPFHFKMRTLANVTPENYQ